MRLAFSLTSMTWTLFWMIYAHIKYVLYVWYVLIWKDSVFFSPQVITTLTHFVFSLFLLLWGNLTWGQRLERSLRGTFFILKEIRTSWFYFAIYGWLVLRKLMWVQFFQNLWDLSGSTETNNGNQDNPSQGRHYHLVKSTQVCSSQSCEGTRKRVGVCSNRPVATMSARRTESEQMVRAPYFTCEEEIGILQRYEEKKNHKREIQHSYSQKKETMSMCKWFRAHEVNVLCKPCV